MLVEVRDRADRLAGIRDLDQEQDLDHQRRAGEDGDGVCAEDEKGISPFFDGEALDKNVTDAENDQGDPCREDDEGARPKLLVDRKIRVKEKPDSG